MAKRRPKQGAAAKVKPGGLAGYLPKGEGAALIVILSLYVLLSVLLFDPKPFVGGDNAAYVILSKALAAGRGLTELWTPEQRPHTQYPFGFPLLLAPVSLLKLPYAWYKIIPWLAGLAGILLSWRFFRKQGVWMAAATCLLLAINPHYLEYSHWVLSELPFLAAMMLSLWAMGRWESGGDWRWFLGSILAASAGIHIRSAGVALLAAVPLHLAFRGKVKWAVIYLAAVAALMLPWAMRNAHWGTSGGYLEQFLMRDPYQPELGRAGLGELASRAGLNLKIYLTSVWPQLLLPVNVALGLGRAGILTLLFLSLPALLGASLGLRDAGAAGWTLFFYLLISTLWPVVWTDLRFALPVLPLTLFFTLRGYRWILGRLFKDKAIIASALLLAALAMASIVPVMAKAGPALAMQAGYRHGDRLAGYDPQWRGFFQAAEWVRGNTPEGSVVVSRKPQLFYLASGRQSFCYPFTADADSVRGRLAKADFVMVEPVSGTVQRYLIPAVEPHMGVRYIVVHAVGNPPTYVLKVNKENENAR